jgi:cell division protein FtsL
MGGYMIDYKGELRKVENDLIRARQQVYKLKPELRKAELEVEHLTEMKRLLESQMNEDLVLVANPDGPGFIKE